MSQKPQQTKKKISTQKPFVWVSRSEKKKKGIRQLSFDDYLKKTNQHTKG